MCSCETSFGSIFLFEIGASVDGAPVVLCSVIGWTRLFVRALFLKEVLMEL